MRTVSVPSSTAARSDKFAKRVGAIAESPFFADSRAPDWFQQLVYELSAGEIACPQRNAFLRDLRAAAKAVQSYEVVRRWTLIGRIVSPRTGLLAQGSAAGPDLDDFNFALVDFVCDLRQADLLDLGWEPELAESWRRITSELPETVAGLCRIGGAAPLLAYRLSQAMASGAEERRIIPDARHELLMATRYGALNREERQAVRGFATSAV